ncbi:hypothetical protein HRbin39_01172 [bacterium HR39]|nr:hypothetical protein HRbin39_01172 [bacterium HR39]
MDIRRRLAERHPDAFAPDLAASLTNLSAHLAALGRLEEALAAIAEAAGIYRRLAERHPDAFEPDLALSLVVQGSILAALGRTKDAHRTFVEALQILRPYFLKLPRVHAELMKILVEDYERACRDLGREPDGELLAEIVPVLERLGLR